MQVKSAVTILWFFLFFGLIKMSENNFQETSNSVFITLPTDISVPAVETVTNFDIDLYNLLIDWKLEDLYTTLQEADISFDTLKYLSKEDIKDAIKSIGLRAKFREKLFVWRKEKYGIDYETCSADSKVISWLKSLNSQSSVVLSSLSTPEEKSNYTLDLSELLNKSKRGKAIRDFYSKNDDLLDFHRQELISIILEDVNYSGCKLNPSGFPPLTKQIRILFPNECEEYYFVPRQGKRNPRGKLYDKYSNIKAKIKKISTQSKSKPEPENSVCYTEIDESISKALKASLSRNCDDWREVKDNWEKSFHVRQKELKNKTQTNSEFLSSWPRYKDARGYELITIDFHLLYPDKQYSLLGRWDDFKKKINSYYDVHLRDKSSKERFMATQKLTNLDSIDYIYTLLLNAVIHPTARFDESDGKRRKVTINDAQESFAVHLVSINNYHNTIGKLTAKYYKTGLTIQPFIIVTGPDIFQLENFYTYFDGTLYKLNSFLECVDICFKIFQTLILEYPKACQGPWTFIQKYFYEIVTKFDINIPSVAALINFLQKIGK